MKVTHEKTENRQAFLKIEVDPPEVEAATEATYRKLVKRVDVPGFRRGKAPRHLFERHFGKDRLLHETLDDLVPDVYKKAVEEQKLEPFSQPHLDVTQENPVVISAVVPLRPVVTLGDYHAIAMKPEEVNVTEEMVDRVVERLRHQHATWETVEREAAPGDVAVIDIESTAKGEPYINRKALQYNLDETTGVPLPGFATQIVGTKKGDTREFTLKFPDDYYRKEMVGAEASFKVAVTEVRQEKLPEVNAEFAAKVSKDATSVEVLRQQIMDEMKHRAEHEVEHAFEDKVVEAATAMSQTEYPPVMLEAETDNLLERYFRNVQQTGQDIEKYLQTVGKTVEQLREDMRPSAKIRLEQALVMGKVAETEQVAATPEEISAEIEEIVNNSEGDKDAMRKALHEERNRESLESTIISRKTLKLLKDIATAKGAAEPEAKHETGEAQAESAETEKE